MEYRRLFIMRKDLHMGAGKLAAQVGHCCEAYWTNLIRKYQFETLRYDKTTNEVTLPNFKIDKDILHNYVFDKFVKTICSAKNLNDLLKAKTKALELGLIEGTDFGLINDACLTDLTPENEDGTTTTGIWFKPLPDEVAHEISKHYQLYRD